MFSTWPEGDISGWTEITYCFHLLRKSPGSLGGLVAGRVSENCLGRSSHVGRYHKVDKIWNFSATTYTRWEAFPRRWTAGGETKWLSCLNLPPFPTFVPTAVRSQFNRFLVLISRKTDSPPNMRKPLTQRMAFLRVSLGGSGSCGDTLPSWENFRQFGNGDNHLPAMFLL